MYFIFRNLFLTLRLKPVSLNVFKNQTRDKKLKERWDRLISILNERFSDGETIDVEGVLYLVGLQELGQIHHKMKKDDNINLIHIGICTVLEPYGYYRFDFYDEEGWPHFERTAEIPAVTKSEQELLMKRALVEYFAAWIAGE